MILETENLDRYLVTVYNMFLNYKMCVLYFVNVKFNVINVKFLKHIKVDSGVETNTHKLLNLS